MNEPDARGPLSVHLGLDHARLGRLLEQCRHLPATDEREAYDRFRAGLLRHVGIEEKLLFPIARRLGDAELQTRVERLHRDHAALAALLVPTPTAEIVQTIGSVLSRHNADEESLDGLYAVCDQLPADELREVWQRVQDAPAVRVAPHNDSAAVHENVRTLLRAANAA
jgi:hypothetical protein